MPRNTLAVHDVGPIQSADVTFGDLTVLVGPQASGKSIFLQLLKLAVDTGAVLSTLKDYGLNWESVPREFLNIYLGEGMGDVWESNTSRLFYDGRELHLNSLIRRQKKKKTNIAFLFPRNAF